MLILCNALVMKTLKTNDLSWVIKDGIHHNSKTWLVVENTHEQAKNGFTIHPVLILLQMMDSDCPLLKEIVFD